MTAPTNRITSLPSSRTSQQQHVRDATQLFMSKLRKKRDEERQKQGLPSLSPDLPIPTTQQEENKKAP